MEQRWYCYKDDEVYFAKEDRWLESVKVLSKQPQGPKCVNCGTSILTSSKFCSLCGQPLTIDVEHVLNSSFVMVKEKPAILLPVFLEVILATSLGSWFFAHPIFFISGMWSSTLSSIVTGVPSFFVNPFLTGTYPSMVQRIKDGNRVSLVDAFHKSAKKYPALLVASILVSLATVGGSFLLFVPGVIIATWYFYTYPAIILENRGALNGMSASKRFGRVRKMDTFVILLIVSVPSLLSLGIVYLQSGGFSSSAIYTLPSILVRIIAGVIGDGLAAIAAAYTYVNYAMPRQVDPILQPVGA